MKEELLHIKKELSKKLKKERFEHTVGVMYTSASLAMRYGANIEKAMTAGLLHDCGKYCSAKEQLKLCEKYKITLTDLEHSMPALIHAKLGAYLAENEYGIKDREVLDAITYHTTGRPEMTMLEKILYIADYIEPRRYKADNLPQMRRLAYEDLDQTMYEILKSTLEYLAKKGADADPMTATAYEYFKQLVAAEK
jgi:predicted HD superfamily hydrolase involved in NAD metabolism